MSDAANGDSSYIQKPAAVVALSFHKLHTDKGSTYCCEVTNANGGCRRSRNLAFPWSQSRSWVNHRMAKAEAEAETSVESHVPVLSCG